MDVIKTYKCKEQNFQPTEQEQKPINKHRKADTNQ